MEDQQIEIEVQKKRKVNSLSKNFEQEIKLFLPQARNLFLEFINFNEIKGERFPNFSLNLVTWAVKRSEKILFINNDDGSLRSFIIIGSNSDWNIEYRIELIAGNKEDYPRLLKKAKKFIKGKSGLILSTLCYPSEYLYNIYEESGFVKTQTIRRTNDNSVKFVKYEFLIPDKDRQYYLEGINSCQEEVIINQENTI